MKKNFDTFGLGARLTEQRSKKRVSPETLVADLGDCVDASYYKRLEAGTRFPSLPLLAALAEYFGTTIDYLLYGNEDDNGTDNSIRTPEEAIKALETMATTLEDMSGMLRGVVTVLRGK